MNVDNLSKPDLIQELYRAQGEIAELKLEIEKMHGDREALEDMYKQKLEHEHEVALEWHRQNMELVARNSELKEIFALSQDHVKYLEGQKSTMSLEYSKRLEAGEQSNLVLSELNAGLSLEIDKMQGDLDYLRVLLNNREEILKLSDGEIRASMETITTKTIPEMWTLIDDCEAALEGIRKIAHDYGFAQGIERTCMESLEAIRKWREGKP